MCEGGNGVMREGWSVKDGSVELCAGNEELGYVQTSL